MILLYNSIKDKTRVEKSLGYEIAAALRMEKVEMYSSVPFLILYE